MGGFVAREATREGRVVLWASNESSFLILILLFNCFGKRKDKRESLTLYIKTNRIKIKKGFAIHATMKGMENENELRVRTYIGVFIF